MRNVPVTMVAQRSKLWSALRDSPSQSNIASKMVFNRTGSTDENGTSTSASSPPSAKDC